MSTLPDRLAAGQRLSDEYWKKWQTKQEPVLHHYTDAMGLHGIITSRKLWLTAIAYLNDATEHQQAETAILEALRLMRLRPNIAARRAAFYRYLQTIFESALVAPSLDVKKDTFVGCFSTKTDSLSQWRAYGRGEGGFSIAFRASKLWGWKQRAQLSPGYWLLPCDYNLSRITALHQQYIDEVFDECLQIDASCRDEIIAQKAAIEARWIGAGIKHSAFEEEQEWRLIYYGFSGPPPEVSYRPNSTLTPYLQFELGNKVEMAELISEVWVGPQRHAELAAAALRDFLKRETGIDIPVKVSEIPFRNL